MKEIKLFVDFEFTSLSPDAQLISVGIVSLLRTRVEPIGGIYGFESKMIGVESKSFYSEFTDFDISRCDDWVKENVVAKLQFYPESHDKTDEYDTQVWDMCNRFENVKIKLRQWLSQFSDYKIQFVVDCGTWDWYWLLQLLAEWDDYSPKGVLILPDLEFTELQKKRIIDEWNKACVTVFKSNELTYFTPIKQGLPKLPSNVSPVPMDLNDLIAFKKGISVSEAFDLNREQYLFDNCKGKEFSDKEFRDKLWSGNADKHNAIWDAKVIKAIYEKLTV